VLFSQGIDSLDARPGIKLIKALTFVNGDEPNNQKIWIDNMRSETYTSVILTLLSAELDVCTPSSTDVLKLMISVFAMHVGARTHKARRKETP
jgi:hypothetical protein